ncbi:hypothetical protein E2P81_ATG04913 [Venturia nashicola]|uniref:Vesicle-mediated transport protein Vid24 n=1 Tax=Venturia nashicola TaxID=86259 RepID=A0A4Z1P2M6_9PEZI|nr:hypothetical protein E6O75_ATG05038 [Venturia nashicola]TLD34748.1 hypothetical protein E2P81_ATG04913 [Venturia nashicola]
MPTRPESFGLLASHTAELRQRCLDLEEAIRPSTGDSDAVESNAPTQQPTPPPEEQDVRLSLADPKLVKSDVDGPAARDILSPVSTQEEPTDADSRLSQSNTNTAVSPQQVHPAPFLSSSLRSPYPKTRYLPNSTSSFLKPGSRFVGSQQSDRQIYDVEVQIQHVDMKESFICGYLRIQGLTEDHPTLTTYFEGEIIGTKYTFETRHEEWGSSEKTDMQHWGRFPAWKPLASQARVSNFSYKNYAQRENIFMRWKEYFLVPDHRVRTISGASFEGFYYICFNQVSGSVSGIYFHAKSEK